MEEKCGNEKGENSVENGASIPYLGWQPLGRLLNIRNELFDRCILMPGYEASSNIYVIRGDYLSIVDPGNDYTAFIELFDLGFKPREIKKVFLTHGHFDHVMGTVELIKGYPEIIKEGGFELILHASIHPEFKEEVRRRGCKVTELDGGEIIEMSGFQWEVIPTPGHTIHGLSLYNPETKTVFTGDTVLPHAMSEPDPAAGGTMGHYFLAMRELLKRDVEHVLPGHGYPVANIGRRIIEETYICLMLRVMGAESGAGIKWLDGARSMVERGLFEEAIFCCDREITRDPQNIKALELKGICLNELGRSIEALNIFDKILSLNSDNIMALAGKGFALIGLGRFDESISCLDAALRIYPNFKEALIYKGMALYLSGRVDEAMDIEPFRDEFVKRFKEEFLRKDEEKRESHN